MLAKWSFTLVLMLLYVLMFHLWLHVNRHWTILSAGIVTVVLNAGFAWAAKRRYFVNRWDLAFHALVILDILIEGLFIEVHDHYGFYFCALGFAILLAGYRLLGARRALARD